LADLKQKEAEFTAKSKDFFSKNEKLKAELQMKEMTVAKLESELKRVDGEVEQSRSKEQQELAKTRLNHEFSRATRGEDRKSRLHK
jgi:multidrug resistance efflux pump